MLSWVSLNGRDHIVDILQGHPGEERQRDNSGKDFFRHGKVPFFVSVGLLVERLQVKRDKMYAGADISLPELFDQTVAIYPEGPRLDEDRENVPGAFHFWSQG